MTVAQIRALTAAIATVSIVGVGLSLSMILITINLAGMGFDGTAIGANVAVAGLATLVGAPFVPRLAARVGTKNLLFVALASAILCLGLFAASRNYWAWLALRAIYSLALTVLFVLSEYWINATTPPARRGFILGCYGMSLALGFAAGPALLALSGLDDNRAFLMAIALFAIAALPLAFGGAVPGLERNANAQRRLVASRVARVPLLAALLHGAIETAGLGLLAAFALRAGLTPAVGAGLVGLFAAGNVLFQVPLGLLSDRIDRVRLLMIAAALGCLGALTLAVLPAGTPAFAIVLLLWGGIVGGFYPIGLAQLGACFKGAELGAANAAFVMCYALGMLTGPALVGTALDLFPAHGFFAANASLLAVFALAAGATQWRRKAGTERDARSVAG